MLAPGQRRMSAVPALVLVAGACGGRALSFDGPVVATDVGAASATDGATAADAGTGILYAAAVGMAA